MKVREVLEGLGTWLSEPVDLPYRGVETDSRRDCRGRIFFALKGERFDGHDFVLDALGRGAVCAVVERSCPGGTFVVEDTLVALGEVASRWRDHLSPEVVGITGSSGKTTTKEMVRTVLSGTFRVYASRGNENNMVGLPLNVANAPEDTQVLVVELGTNAPGEIGRLSAICRPSIAVITSIGESHLEGLGTVDGVFREKMDILCRETRYLLFPAHSPFAHLAGEMCKDMGVELVLVGEGSDNRVRELEPGLFEFVVEGRSFRARMAFCGHHLGLDALYAITVARIMGIPVEESLERLSGFVPVRGRFSILRLGNLTLIDDTYNANPLSTKAALDYLAGLEGPKAFVMGSMLELGKDSPQLHRMVGRYARERGVDLMVTLGEDARMALEAFVELGGRGVHCESHREAVEVLREELPKLKVILVKGSRGMRMEKVVEGLRACSGS